MLSFKDNQELDMTDWVDLKKNLLEADLPVLFICTNEAGFRESNILLLALALKKLSGAV